MANAEAEEHCSKGNDAFREKKWDEAIKLYNKAITLEPNCAKYYSNRSGAWSSKGNHDSALADANRCLEKDPAFVKGYARKGKALWDLGRWDEAEESYKKGLELDASNASLKQNLADVTAARARGSSSSSSAGSSSSGGEGFGGRLMSQIVEKIKSGGRMQMYMLLFGGYYLFNAITGRGSKGSEPAVKEEPLGHSFDFDETVEAPNVDSGVVSRRFTEVDSNWISYLQLGSRSTFQHVLLHSTASSASSEYTPLLKRLSQVVARSGAGSKGSDIMLLAPDRPCHGLSPCPDGESAFLENVKWLDKLITTATPRSKKMLVTASGREAAQEALSLAARRDSVKQVVLVRPTRSPPSWRRLSSTEDVVEWLNDEKLKIATPEAVADAARWAVSKATSAGSSAAEALDAEGVPNDCKVSIIYLEGEEQDSELHAALGSQGIKVATHSVTEAGVVGAIADEMREAFDLPAAADSSSADL